MTSIYTQETMVFHTTFYVTNRSAECGLLASFSNMFGIWAYDLIRNGPSFSTGKTYLCISPEITEGTQGTDDSSYISPYLRWFLTRFLLRVQGRFSSVEDFRWTLACVLLEAADLEVFSLWSPSFLTTQLDCIQALAWGQTMLNARQGKLLNWSTCDKMNEAF